MKVVSITSRQLKRMPLLQISNKVVNTEGKLYIYDHKDKWNYLREIIKIYYVQSEDFLSKKIYTISQLLANSSYLDMPELVLPTSLVSIEGNINGFSMPLVENNINLAIILGNPEISLELKLFFLKEILKILQKIENIKELRGKFFLGDIHEANFLFDFEEQIIKIVDLDSSYINGSGISVSKFLTKNIKLFDNPQKYPLDLESNFPIPNHNTTILSFIYILLNVLSGNTNSHRWSINEFYSYISYLEKNGVAKEVLDAIIRIYIPNKENYFDVELLDSINVNKDYSLARARISKSNNGYY